MQAKLVVVGGEAKAAEISLKLPTIIGRGRDATLTLPHPLVSRQHCEIFENNGQLFVRDLGSLNGTFVGSQRITEAPLPSGELLTVGTVTFRAVYEQAPLPPQSSPIVNSSTPTPRGSATVKPTVSPLSATEKDPVVKSAATIREAPTAAKPAPAAPAAPVGEPKVAKPVADTAPVEDDDILDLLEDEGDAPADQPPLDFSEEDKGEGGEELSFDEEVAQEPAKPALPIPGKPVANQPAKPASDPAPAAKPVSGPAAPAAKPIGPPASSKDRPDTIFVAPPADENHGDHEESAASDESLSEFFKRLK